MMNPGKNNARPMPAADGVHLGQRFSSNLGPPPFDPVSIGLAWLLVRWRSWAWSTLVTELNSKERGLGYCRRLGFDPGDIPAESTFREAIRNTDEAWLLQCEDSLIQGLMAYGIIPTQSTFPGDPPERGVSIATDCQLVAARTQARQQRDWAQADDLRGQIEALGWQVNDTPDGPKLVSLD